MKAKVILVSLLLSISFLSCKNEKKGDIKGIEEVKSNNFEVKIEANVKKDDQMVLYFQDETIPWFDEEHTVWANVKGSNDTQQIVFKVPEQFVPTNFRFDISNNGNQDPIEFKKMIITYMDKSFEVDSKNLETFFAMNDFVKYDLGTGIFTMKKDNKGVYDPFFVGKESIFPQIRKITGKQ